MHMAELHVDNTYFIAFLGISSFEIQKLKTGFMKIM